jgi:sulfate adenylyltransferase subunit 2
VRALTRPRLVSARWATPPTPAASSHQGDTEEVVAEVAATRLTERGATRADDRISESGMEDRKKEGYF